MGFTQMSANHFLTYKLYKWKVVIGFNTNITYGFTCRQAADLEMHKVYYNVQVTVN